MSLRGRSRLYVIMKRIIDSYKREHKGKYVGKDLDGNEYYEIQKNEELNEQSPRRWFSPKDPQNITEPLTQEWQSWLRQRRNDPPKESELIQNLDEATTRRLNAEKMEEDEWRENPHIFFKIKENRLKEILSEQNPYGYPVYEDLELIPGTFASFEDWDTNFTQKNIKAKLDARLKMLENEMSPLQGWLERQDGYKKITGRQNLVKQKSISDDQPKKKSKRKIKG